MKRDFAPRVRFVTNSTWSLFLNTLRQISQLFNLSLTLHKLRQLVHFGPWRVIPIFLIRKLRPFLELQHESHSSLLGSIDPIAIAEELRQKSMVIVGVLPEEFVTKLREITDHLPFEEYQLVQEVNEDVRRLAEDPGIKRVLGAYLKCEPALLEVSLFVSKPGPSLVPKGQNSFHFDYAGWESLNVLVYLTDVTENSSYHVIAKGSHRNRTFLDVIRGTLSVEEGQCRYGDAIQNITGPAGTLFFENTEAFHRRRQGNERRVMLNLLYASHRSFLSHGRASPTQIETRNRAFRRLDGLGHIE